MDRWTGMQVFRTVVELRGFTAAAARLQISPAMASKHVMQLERHLGVRLLHRTSRQVSLTEDGQRCYAQCCGLLDGLDALETQLRSSTAQPQGLLRVSAPVWMACERFVAVLRDFRERFPQVRVELDLSGRLVNLVNEGFDVVLRVARSPGDTLIARQVGSVVFTLVATPAYLARAGTPQTLEALASHEVLWYSMVSTDLIPLGLSSKLTPVMASNNETLLHLAALKGMGIAMLPDWLVSEDVQQGRLVPLLTDDAALRAPLHGMYVSRAQLAPKVRAFIDFLAADPRMHERPGVAAAAIKAAGTPMQR